ncbi:MAG TPA: archease [Micromonosporaceae bacterium]|nr:archease [Micromonosporaceae bacterium]
MGEHPPAGHRRVPHTADLRIEAWAPSRERCVAEAVTALVDSFTEMPPELPTTTVGFRAEPGTDEDLLVGVLDEVIFRMDTAGQLPADVEVTAADGGLDVQFRMVDTDRVELIGAVPKAVSLYELRFERREADWACAVTLDV